MRLRRRRWWILPALLVLVVLAFSAWVAVRVLQVRGDLEAVRAELTGVELDRSQTAQLRESFGDAAPRAESARARTHDPLWLLAERAPFLGDDLAAVRLLSASVDDVVARVAIPLLEVADSADPDQIRGADGSFDLAPLAAARPQVESAVTAASTARARLSAVETGGLIGPVAAAVDAASEQLDELQPTLDSAALVARLAPPMLGHEEPRRYFLAFQNPAESRGTGGIVGVYAILRVESGRLSIERIGENGDLPVLDAPPVDLGPDYAALYGPLPGDVNNANLSPHFPYAAQNLLAFWHKASGESLDGVVALDPPTLAYLLDATGPVTLSSGEEVTADSAVVLTLSQVYERFEEQTDRRDFLGELVAAVFEQLTAPRTEVDELLDALAAATSERRLLLYSAHAEEQADLETTPLAGMLPSPGPVRGIVVNNAGSNKLDFFLDREVVYEIDCGTSDRTPTRLVAVLRNDAPVLGLPDYVTSHGIGLPEGATTNRVIVSAFVPAPTGLDGVMVDGVPTGAAVGSELGYDVFAVTVDLPPGMPVQIVWLFDEPAVGQDVELFEQPLVRPIRQRVVDVCDDAG